MKTLYLIRHGKSSWSDPSLHDAARPLNKRGLRDAPFMAKMLRGKGAKPDALVSSPANRALTTASYFAVENGIPVDQVIQNPEIYEASTTTLMRVISELSDEWDTVFIYGHNPTFTDLANRFTDQYLPNVPTCGICRIDSSENSWKAFDPINSKLTEFHFPKQYFS